MLLFKDPDPDFSRLEKVLRRQGEPDRVPFIELFADVEIMEACLGEPIPREVLYFPDTVGREEWEAIWKRVIRFWHGMGYDYLSVPCGLLFRKRALLPPATRRPSRSSPRAGPSASNPQR